jgi:hypothetical protein
VNIGTHTGVAVPCLFTLAQSSAGCFCALLSAAETDSVSGQVTQPYWKAFGDLVAFVGVLQILNYWLFLLQVNAITYKNYFNISAKLTQLISFFVPCRG